MIPARREETFSSRLAGKLVACLYGQKHCRDETSRIAREISTGNFRGKFELIFKMANAKSRFILMGIIPCFLFVFQMLGALAVLLECVNKRNTIIMSMLMSRRRYLFRKMKGKRISQLRRKQREVWYKQGRTDQWWKNVLSGKLSDEEWQRNFRLSRTEFFELEKEIRRYISPDSSSPNYRAISAKKKLAITLYYLKDTGSLRMTANTFGIHVCTASKTIHDVCEAISYHLGPKYIKLPQNEEQMREKIAEFEAKYGFIQAFGCIDGTHIPIKRPQENSQDYYCLQRVFLTKCPGCLRL